jgi:hypothetical protein
MLPMNNSICHQWRKDRSRGSVRWIAAALITVVVLFASIPAYAAIGAIKVAEITTSDNLSSYSFPSKTYSNNVLYIAFTTSTCQSSGDPPCSVNNWGAPLVTSLSGAGLTFTEIGPAGGQGFASDNRRIQAWRAQATSGAGTGVVTITLDNTSYSMGAVIIAFTGTKTSGTNGSDAVANYASTEGTATSLTVNMAAFANSNNRPVAWFSHREAEPTTHETGYTELHDTNNGTTPVMGYMAEWHATVAETSPSASWTDGSNGGFALEIAAASSTTTRTVAIHPSGTTAPAGYDATYTSMSAMEAAEDGNLVNLNRFLRVEIVNSDGDWTTADTTVIFDGWKCDKSAGQYVEIEVMSGARNPYTDGKWSTSHYRLSSSSSTIALLIDNDNFADAYFEADFIGLQVENTGGGLAAQVRDNAWHKTIRFIASHFRGTAAFEVIQLMDNGTAEVWFINSILENSLSTNDDEILRATSAWQTAGTAAAYFYNCTVVGGGLEGLDVSAGTITVKNCAVFNNGTNDIYQSGATVDYVASDASVGTNWVDISPAAEADGWNAAVTDYVNGDYRVKDTNSVLYQAGLSRSSDTNVPTEDIAGNARPTGSDPVSIGAFESIGGGGGNTPPNVYAGVDKNITLPSTVDLSDATADDGGDGPGPLTYTWTKQSGSGTVTFTPNDSVLNPTASFSTDDTYVLRLTVNDGTEEDSDDVEITVNPSGGGVGTPITAGDVADYSCNMKITIDHTQVAFTSPQNFPVLISLTDDSLKTSGCGFLTDSDGDDIIFTNSNLTFQLYHEIEKYDETTGEIVAWVLVPALSGTADTDIYMYFGNSNVTSPTESPTEVWDSNYAGVWHLKEDPTDPAPEFDDSTANGNNGYAEASMDSADQVSGQIDGSIDLNGSNQYIDAGTSSSLNPTNYITVEAWVSVTDTGDQDRAFVVKGDGTIDDSGSNPYAYALWSEGNSACDQVDFCINDVDNDGANCVEEASAPGLCGSGWHHLVGTYDGSYLRIFIDGSPEQTKALASATITRGTSYPVVFGRDSLNGSNYTGGTFDEVRISNVARSADWIETEYNNQSDPSSFYSVVKQCPSWVPEISEFTCSIPITIDSSKVSGTSDLINFPVLISLTDIDLKTTSNCGYIEDSDGYDIIFSDSTQTIRLDHEIEKYDGAAGELIAWVKIPTLSATSDTTINLHFGHSGGSSGCGPTENPTGVWDSNYEAVLHLQESANGTSDEYKDSTSNAHHGTGGGLAGAGSSSQTPSRTTGVFGYAQDFDGSDDLIRLNAVDDGSWTAVTVQAWINPDDTGDDRLFGKCWGTGSNDETWLLRKPSGGSFGVRMRTDTNYNGGYDPGSLSTANWQLVAATWDASDNQLRVFKNGVQQGATTLAGSHLFSNSTGETGYPDADYLDEPTLGNTPNNDRDYNGKMQEARLSKTARSADWLLTEYNNQSNPSSFYSVGASNCFSLSGFSCNRKITIDSSMVEGTSDLTNFPVLIKIERDCNIKTAANGGSVQNSSGYDIVFADSDGLTQLAHEIEEYDGDSGDLVAWVKIPTLPYDSDKDIYMYYGKSGITCDPSNPTGVWDSDYVGVWHFKESSGSGSYLKNSKQNAYHADPDSSSPFVEDAKIAGGRDVNQIDFDNGGDLLDGDTAFTLSFWGYPNYASDAEWEANEDHMFNTDSMWGLRWSRNGANDPGTGWIQADVKFTSGTNYFNDWDHLLRAQWNHLVLNYDGSALRWYINGDMVKQTTGYTGQALLSNSTACLGYCWGGGGGGYVDELRYSRSARSAGWIATEYNNQIDPSSFYSMSQDTCGGSHGFNFRYCKKITVDHTRVIQASNANFPLMINLQNYDDLKTEENGGRVGNDNGWDIVFRDKNCVTLDHEIDYYDGTTGTLVAWVRIPDLTNTEDYEVYMYYGDSDVTCSPENPDGLWDPTIYEAVYHLSDDYNDSTSNDRDGTNYGTTFTSSQIGRGALFTPANGWDHIDLGAWNVNDNDLVIQAWAWPNDFNQGDPRVVSKCSTTSSGAQSHVFMLSLYNGTSGENRMRFRIKTGTDDALNTVQLFGSNTTGCLPDAQEWYFLMGSYFDSTDQMKLWRDSTGDTTAVQSGWLRQNSWPVWIGANPYNSSNSNYSWDGILDEVRIISQPRSAGWITTEYRNQSDPGNFYTVGSCFEQTTEVTQEWVEEVQ